MSASNCIDLYPCPCACHGLPNNAGCCMICSCNPRYRFRNLEENSGIINKIGKIESMLSDLYKDIAEIQLNVNRLTKNSHQHGCPVCDGKEWDYISL